MLEHLFFKTFRALADDSCIELFPEFKTPYEKLSEKKEVGYLVIDERGFLREEDIARWAIPFG